MRQFQCPVHFVGRNVVEAFALVAFRQGFPILFGRLEQAERSHDVGTCESERVFDAPVHVAFGGQMDDAVHMVLPDEFAHLVEIANVRFDESIVRPVFDVFQIGQVSGVGQLVQVDNMVVRILVDEKGLPMKPAPPVMMIFLLKSMMCCIIDISFLNNQTTIRHLSGEDDACPFPTG